MHPFYEDFVGHLEREDKEKSVDFVLSKLASNEIDIVTLYNELLAPSLNNLKCEGPEEFCIWKEHVRSSIVRTIIECTYPYVMKERKRRSGKVKGQKVMVICPPEELHEIGSRMVADFFALEGYDVTYVGANTPKASFLSAVKHVRPKYVALSVSNYYNLLAAKKTIGTVREAAPGELTVIAGGKAFEHNSRAFKEIGADLLLRTYEDIKNLGGGD